MEKIILQKRHVLPCIIMLLMMMLNAGLANGKRCYPLVICYIAIENGPVEIVDFPSYKMVDLSSSLCKRLPEGIWRYVLSNNAIITISNNH